MFPEANDSSAPPPDDESKPRDDLERRLAFLELSQADAERLRELRAEFARQAERFVESFYRHLFVFPETSQFLQDDQLVERLKQAQREHFESLLDAAWDEPFVAQRRAVGEAHARVGVEPQWFLGAYNQYLQHWLGRWSQDPSQDEEGKVSVDAVRSLVRVVLLDIGLTLDAYFLELTRQMRTALNMYWKANSDLRQFAHLASHDMKTPLSTVANLCDEVIDEFGAEIPSEALELLEKARTRIFRIGATIDELLSSTVHGGGAEGETVVDMNAVLAEVAEELRPQIEKNGIQLLIAPHLGRALGNHARLREVFSNLLSNAVKFIDRHPGRIEVEGGLVDDECVVRVCDNGSGVPREEQQRIFSPFRRLRNHQHLPGSGLGLYFTRNIVEQLGGRIWVESEEGRGTCFCVALRAA